MHSVSPYQGHSHDLDLWRSCERALHAVLDHQDLCQVVDAVEADTKPDESVAKSALPLCSSLGIHWSLMKHHEVEATSADTKTIDEKTTNSCCHYSTPLNQVVCWRLRTGVQGCMTVCGWTATYCSVLDRNDILWADGAQAATINGKRSLANIRSRMQKQLLQGRSPK